MGSAVLGEAIGAIRDWSVKADSATRGPVAFGSLVFNDAEQADGFLNWKRPQTHAFTIKFTRQFGTGG